MRIFVCKDRYENIMTCIYDAWEWSLKNGHENMKIMKEPIIQPSLFDEYVYIDEDKEKSLKVTNSIISKISKEAYACVYYATLLKEDVLDDIYRFLRIGFKVGNNVTKMLTETSVIRMMEIRRQVYREMSFFREFIRFNSIGGNVYVAHIEPKNNIAYMTAEHFADRMPSENWIIVDDTRRLAVIHPKDEEIYISYLNEKEMQALKTTEQYNDKYTSLWQTFFDSIAIKQRENYRCQRNHFPIWMRKHVVEFMGDNR